MITTNACSRIAVVFCASLILGSAVCRADDATPAAPSANSPSMTVTPSPTVPGAYLLRYKFAPGQTTHYKMVMDTTGTMTMSGRDIPMNQHFEIGVTMTVQSVNADGSAVIKSGMDSVTGTMNGQPLPSSVTDKMNATQESYTQSTTGKITQMSMPSPGGLSPGTDMTKMSQLGQMSPLPEQAVKPGDAWRSTMTLGMLGMDMYSKMTLNSVQNVGGVNVAQIESKFYSASKPGGNVSSSLPVKMDTLMNGSGITEFDMDAGALKSATGDMTMTMTMAPISSGQQSTGPMKMQMVTKTRMDEVPAPPAPVSPAIPSAQ